METESSDTTRTNLLCILHEKAEHLLKSAGWAVY